MAQDEKETRLAARRKEVLGAMLNAVSVRILLAPETINVTLLEKRPTGEEVKYEIDLGNGAKFIVDASGFDASAYSSRVPQQPVSKMVN